MRIGEVAISGFGRFHDVRYHPAAGLTVIRGDNEAGKTTVLAFIRAMLFGFETDRYPALAGGRRGGWLRVTTADDRPFRIERYASSERAGGAGRLAVIDAAGTDRGAPFLTRLLQGVEATLFRNVFAFGLEELSEFKRLTDGEVAARIYGAGLGTGAASALDVEEQLRAEQRRIFLPSGELPSLNRLVKDLDEVEARLRGRDLPAEYATAQRRLRELEDRLIELGRDLDAARAAQLDDDRVLTGWPSWVALRAAEEELSSLEDPGPLPPDALGRQTELLAALRTAQRARTDAAEARRRIEERLNGLELDALILGCRAEIEAILDQRNTYRAQVVELKRAEGELALARGRADDHVARLGAGWDRDAVLHFEDSIAVRTAITGRFRASLDSSGRDVQRAEDDLRSSERVLDEARTRVADLDERLGRLPTPGRVSLDEREAQLRRLETAFAEQAALERIEPALAETAQRATAEGSSGRSRLALAVALAVVAAAGAIVLGVMAGTSPILTVVLAALAAVAAGTIAWLATGRSRGAADLGVAVEHRQRMSSLASTIERLAADLGLGEARDHSSGELDRLREGLRDDRAVEAQRTALAQQRESEASRVPALERARGAAVERLAAARRAEESAVAEWRSWLEARGLPNELDRESAAAIVDAIAAAKARLEAEAVVERRVAEMRSERERFVSAAARLFAKLGRSVPADDRLLQSLDALAVELSSAVECADEATRLRRELGQACALEGRLDAEVQTAAQDHARLLAECNVADDAELRRRVEVADRRREVQGRIDAHRTTLTALSAPGEAFDRLTRTLRSVTDIADVERRSLARSGSLAALTAERDEALLEVGGLKGRLAELETSVEASEDRQRRADLRARIEADAERWAVLALAGAMLRRTRERFEREHRPAVVCAAEQYLAAWTDGRYRRIVAPLDQPITGIERADGLTVPLAGLSRGTAEQLYLALRFGLVERFAAEAEPLPLVMDEILVNFDERRARATAESIRDLATRHQILYFTCRPSEWLHPDLELRLQPATLASAPSAADSVPETEQTPILA